MMSLAAVLKAVTGVLKDSPELVGVSINIAPPGKAFTGESIFFTEAGNASESWPGQQLELRQESYEVSFSIVAQRPGQSDVDVLERVCELYRVMSFAVALTDWHSLNANGIRFTRPLQITSDKFTPYINPEGKVAVIEGALKVENVRVLSGG